MKSVALGIRQGLMREVCTNGWADIREGSKEMLSDLNSKSLGPLDPRDKSCGSY